MRTALVLLAAGYIAGIAQHWTKDNDLAVYNALNHEQDRCATLFDLAVACYTGVTLYDFSSRRIRLTLGDAVRQGQNASYSQAHVEWVTDAPQRLLAEAPTCKLTFKLLDKRGGYCAGLSQNAEKRAEVHPAPSRSTVSTRARSLPKPSYPARPGPD